MQTVESLYGMYVRCNDAEHQQYIELKAKLEQCCRDITQKMVYEEHRGADMHFVSLDNGYKLSFCMYEKELHLAIINREKTQMYRRCEFNVLKEMSDAQINQMGVRADNILNTPERHISMDERITAMWKEAIAREKLPENVREKRSKDMTLDEKVQYYTMKSDIEKVFAEKSTNVQEKIRTRDTGLER